MLAQAARDFLRKADEHKEEFVKFGSPPSLLTDLRQTLDVFEAAMTDRRPGRGGVAGATADINKALAAGAESVKNLNAVVRNVAAGNAGLLATWERDMKTVTWERKSQKKNAASDASAAEPAPGTVPQAS